MTDRRKEQAIFQDLPRRTKAKVQHEMANVVVVNGEIYNRDTGENVTERYDIVLRTTDDQIRRLQETDELTKHQADNGEFIFAFFEKLVSVEERFPTLNKPDIARLMYISTFISWEQNRLQSANGLRHYDKEDVRNLVGMSPRGFRRFYNRIEGEGIITEDEKGGLYIDPTVFYRGRLSKHTYDITNYEHTRLFRKTVRDLYGRCEGRRLRQLAVIYTVLPYLNFSTNIVAHNPDETSEELIRPLGLTELAELVGYKDAAAMKRALNNVKIDGVPVFGFFENPHDRREYRIVVNPRVVFAGNGEALAAVKAMFN